MKRFAFCSGLLWVLWAIVFAFGTLSLGAGPDFSSQTATIRADLYALHGAEAQIKIAGLLNSGSLSEPQKAETLRLQEFAIGLIEWNRWVKSRFARIPSGEIIIGDIGVYVVESNPESMTLQMDGQTVVCKPDYVPRKLAEYLVRKRLSDPSTQRIFGIYLCMYPRGDRAKARELWDSAQKRNLDCSRLYPELDVPIPASVVASASIVQTNKTLPVPQRSLVDLNNPAFLVPASGGPALPANPAPSTQKDKPIMVPADIKSESAILSESETNPVSAGKALPKPVQKPVQNSVSAPVPVPVTVTAPVKQAGRPRPNRSGQNQFPPKVQFLIEDAIKAFADKDFIKGRRLLVEASCMDIKATDAEFLLGLSYVFSIPDLDLARYSFEECLARNPKFSAAYNNLALVLLLQSRYTEALTNLKQAQKLSPNAQELIQNVCLWLDQIDLYSGSEKETIRKELESMKSAFEDVSRYNPKRGWKYMKSGSETGRNSALLKIFYFRNEEGKRIGMPYEDIRNVSL